MIVGIKTERFIIVQGEPVGGFSAYGIERRSELHATKGWRPLRSRRQLLGPCERRDAHRARTQGTDTSFAYVINDDRADRGVTPIPITEKMLMRHRERRRDIQRAANIARNAEEDRQLRKEQSNGG